MIQPRRKPTHTWSCKTCGAELGRIKQASGIGTMLHATGLINARPSLPARDAWLLMCPQGHETRWMGEIEFRAEIAA